MMIDIPFPLLTRSNELIKYLDDCGIRQWVNFRPDKAPCAWRKNDNPDPLAPEYVSYAVDGQDPKMWCGFKTARDRLLYFDLQKEHGIGFVLRRGDGIVAIDIDYPKALPGESQPTLERVRAFERVRDGILADFPESYAEHSVSEKGIHIWILGEIPANVKGSLDGVTIEMYANARYMTITGNFLPGRNIPPREHQSALSRLYDELATLRPKPVAPVQVPPREGRELNKREIERYSRLFAGEWQGQYPSQSEADLALCVLLAKKHGTDPAAIDAEFRASGLYRDDKWERDDYRDVTIQKGIAAAFFANVEEPAFIPKHSGVSLSLRHEPLPEVPFEFETVIESTKSIEAAAAIADRNASDEPCPDHFPNDPSVVDSDGLGSGETIADLSTQDEESPGQVRADAEPEAHTCDRCKRSLATPPATHGAGCVVHGLEAGAGKGWFSFGKVSIIAGSSGSGKSYWLCQLLDDVRRGQSFCGHRTTKSEYLVLLRDRSLQDAAETWMQQFGLLGEWENFWRGFRETYPTEHAEFSSHFIELTDEEKTGVPATVIDKYARLHPDIRIFAIEGLDLWVPSKMLDPDKVEASLRGLQNVAKRYGLALIGTLGSPKVKGAESYIGRDTLFGSTITGRMSDTVVTVNKYKREDHNSARVYDVLLRKAKSERFYFDWDDDGIFAAIAEPGTASGDRRFPGETRAYRKLADIAQRHIKPGEAIMYSKLGPSWGCHENTFNKWRQWALGRFLVQHGEHYFLDAALLPGVRSDQPEEMLTG